MQKFQYSPPDGFRDGTYYPNPVNGTEAREQFMSLLDQLRDFIQLITVMQNDQVVMLRINEEDELETSLDGKNWTISSSSGHKILDASGTQYAQRSKLQFLNSTVIDTGEVTQVVGVTGPQGERGEQGIQGPIGPQGIQGIQGEQGEQGIQGIKGETGATGPQGIQGERGLTGERGPTGIQGPKGDTGLQGPKGDTGPQGAQGPKGDKGDTGEAGPQGTSAVIPEDYQYALEVDGDGNLYVVYPDGGTPQSFELDDDGNLYAVVTE